MPDLNQQLFYHCRTAESFQVVIEGSQEYRVTLSAFNPGPYQYNWFCPCKAYKFSNKEKPCKHIEEAKKKQCGWMQSVDGGEVIEHDGKHYCPECNNRAESRYWGV